MRSESFQLLLYDADFSALTRLVNPYVQPVLYIRRPGSDLEEMHTFPDDDPFFSEVGANVRDSRYNR